MQNVTKRRQRMHEDPRKRLHHQSTTWRSSRRLRTVRNLLKRNGRPMATPSRRHSRTRSGERPAWVDGTSSRSSRGSSRRVGACERETSSLSMYMANAGAGDGDRWPTPPSVQSMGKVSPRRVLRGARHRHATRGAPESSAFLVVSGAGRLPDAARGVDRALDGRGGAVHSATQGAPASSLVHVPITELLLGSTSGPADDVWISICALSPETTKVPLRRV